MLSSFTSAVGHRLGVPVAFGITAALSLEMTGQLERGRGTYHNDIA
jgi:hypothetical protein